MRRRHISSSIISLWNQEGHNSVETVGQRLSCLLPHVDYLLSYQYQEILNIACFITRRAYFEEVCAL